MFPRVKALVLALSLLPSFTLSTPTPRTNAGLNKRQTSVDSFVAAQVVISEAGVLANIGTGGSKAAGASAGVVVASPSKTNPDYFYSWTRDTALVFKSLIDRFVAGETALETHIKDFVTSTGVLQKVTNRSGGPTTGGLGEPKYNANETAFNGDWGRPQRDGPALRAIALMTYADAIYAGQTSYVTNTIWPLIQNDLGYVVTYWNQTGFDLWEEVSGSSFFTYAVQHQSLRLGYTFSGRFGTANANYQSTAANVLCFLQSFWNGNYYTANINTNNGRSGKDANSILTAIHTFDPKDITCSDATLQPCSPKMLANHKVVVDSFRTIYTINSGLGAGKAAAVGRYPEDSYFGGNPWYLNTLAAAEQLYDALYVWGKLDFSSTVTAGTYASSTATYTTLTAAIKAYADGFVANVQKYTPSNGGLAEQYSRSTGAPLSAVDLTWSYASFVTMADRRSGAMGGSWGSSGLVSTCTGGGGGGGGSGVSATFKLTATTTYGQEEYVTGNTAALGNWNPASAFHLTTDSSTYPVWSASVSLPASTTIEYKYLRKETDGTFNWETGSNRQLTTPASGAFTQSDTFRT